MTQGSGAEVSHKRKTHSGVEDHGVDLWDLQAGSERGSSERRRQTLRPETRSPVVRSLGPHGFDVLQNKAQKPRMSEGELGGSRRRANAHLLDELAPAPAADLSISCAHKVRVGGQQAEDGSLVSCKTDLNVAADAHLLAPPAGVCSRQIRVHPVDRAPGGGRCRPASALTREGQNWFVT